MNIFICHTSADKSNVVRPLAESLPQNIKCWIDENEILWGDSVTEKVNAALQNSDYVIVALSTDFIKMNWPQRELNAVLNIEAATGVPKVLPLVVGNANKREAIISQYPLLNDKLYMRWPEDKVRIIDHITKLTGRVDNAQSRINAGNITPNNTTLPEVYLPAMQPKNPTDKDKQDYSKDGFNAIYKYFQVGVSQLESSCAQIDVELELINSKKFTARAFRDGRQVSGCKVWLGGMLGPNSIMYNSSADKPDDDSGFNDMLTIEQNELNWKAMSTTAALSGTNGRMNHQGASEYFWKKFVQPLEWN